MITKENLNPYYEQGVSYKMLTRKFEADLPKFTSHNEVRKFFKGLFAGNFVLQSSEGEGAEQSTCMGGGY
ncbi:MAG: hypothetical protein ACE3L7_33020 [Candidatus Pristimantibacillus sp.]